MESRFLFGNTGIILLDLQVCCAGAYFKTPIGNLSTPYIFVLGYRSPELQLDFRTNDLGVLFKDMKMAPLESSFSITAVGPSHTAKVKFLSVTNNLLMVINLITCFDKIHT